MELTNQDVITLKDMMEMKLKTSDDIDTRLYEKLQRQRNSMHFVTSEGLKKYCIMSLFF